VAEASDDPAPGRVGEGDEHAVELRRILCHAAKYCSQRHLAQGQSIDGTKVATVELGSLYPKADLPNDVLADRRYTPVGKLDSLDLAGYGYRWIRLSRAAAG